jgi:ABC-type uncharacterized transport system ATPase subunit
VDDKTNVISLTQAVPTGEIDTILAKHGLNRSLVEEQFAQKITHEVPDVARLEWMLQANREFRQMAEEMAADALAEAAEFKREERKIEEAIVGAKWLALERPEMLASNTDETKKPKRKRKSR